MRAQAIEKLTIPELIACYRSRELSPVEVIDRCLARVEMFNPRLNAVVTETADTARVAAREAEQRWRTGEDAPPLLGIPFTVKDTLPTAGVRTTFGSPLFSDVVPTEDGAAVHAAKRAGAILIGKTNTPTLGWIAATHNKLFGATRNPWRPDVTPGGSSGGAAVAALAGFAPLNIGTDGGGSLRIPAAFTGTVGFKPTYGRVPGYPTGPNWGLQHIGSIARTTADVAAALDVLAAPDDRDPYCLPTKSFSFAQAIAHPPSRLKVLFCPDFGFAEAVDPEIVTICRAAAQRLQQLGHHVSEGVPAWSSPMAHWQTLFVAGAAARLGPFVAERGGEIEDKLRAVIAEGGRQPSDAYYRAWIGKNDWWQEVRTTWQDYDLVASPVTACSPFALGLDTPGHVAGRPVSFYGWMPFTAPFNLTGQPAISVPAGMTDEGLPVGLQIVGRRFADDLVLAVAADYERARPWADQTPPGLIEA